MAPTIPLPRNEDLSPEILDTLANLPPANVFRMLANAPASFKPFMDLALSILVLSEFDSRLREIAILRVAHATRAHYEWVQHVLIAKGVGVTEDEIAKIGSDGPVTSLDADGNLCCRVADEISRDVRLSDAALEQLLDRYGVRKATELILCVSYFNMLSRFLESTRVPLEDKAIL